MKIRRLVVPLLVSILFGGSVAGTLAATATPVASDVTASPVASPLAVAEVVAVDFFTVDTGDCVRPTGQAAFELAGDGYDGAGAGTLAPWGGGNAATGAIGAIPVQYGEAVLDNLNLGTLLGGRTTSVVARNGATGEVMACGEIGGVVQKAGHFWQHDRLIVGLQPVGNSGVWGTVTFTEDTGVLNDRINVSVALVSAGQWSAYPLATPTAG